MHFPDTCGRHCAGTVARQCPILPWAIIPQHHETCGQTTSRDALRRFRVFIPSWQSIIVRTVSHPPLGLVETVPTWEQACVSPQAPVPAPFLPSPQGLLRKERRCTGSKPPSWLASMPCWSPSSSHWRHSERAPEEFIMTERVSLILRIMRNELAAERQRMKADIADVASLMAGAQLALKQSRALVLAPPSWPAPVAPPPDLAPM
jgi:hypothetical protein